MDLKTHLAIRTPVVWVTTDEPMRVIDILIDEPKRDVYRMHALKGFCRWHNERWEQILVGDGVARQPTNDLNEALPIVAKAGGTLVIEQAHELPLAKLVGAFVELFRDCVLKDNAENLPAQLILCSYKDELPEPMLGVNRIIQKCTIDLPDMTALMKVTSTLASHAELDIDPELMIQAGRAASGLSETEAIVTTLASFAQKSTIDVSYLSKTKLHALKAGGLLEVRSPKFSLDDVGGLDKAKEMFNAISWLWQHPTEAEQFDVVPPRRVLLIGLQGAGKSLVAEATAASLGLDLAKGGISNAMTKWVGESEANMRRMFRQIQAMAPIVFWVDEFGRDASGGASSSEVDGGTTDRVHGEFLGGLQELPENVFLLAAANRIDHLPPEMTRADRFDKILFVGFPTASEREEIFKIHLGSNYSRFDLGRLAGVTPLFTGAEIKALIRETRFNVVATEHRAIHTEDLVMAAPSIKARAWNRHRDQIVEMYKRAVTEWDWASSAQQAEADEVLKASKAKVIDLQPHHTPAQDFSPATFD